MIVGRDCFYKNCPTKGDEYYFVSDGKIQKQNWEDTPVDMIRWRTGNCFKTGADAIFAFNKSIVIAKLKCFADVNNDEISWKKNTEKFYLRYKRNIDAIEVVACVYEPVGDIVFSSREIAEQAIVEVGQENLKKYYFGQEE